MALPVSRLVRVIVNLSPIAAARRSFGVLMIAGDSDVINASERYRSYGSLDEVADEFGTDAPEYHAAALYFGQTPKPSTLMIGRWLRTAVAGFNQGAILTLSQQALSNFTVITAGTFGVTIDGVAKALTGIDLSGATNLNGVATIINNTLTGGTVAWDGERFTITSATTGISSIVGYATVGTLATAMGVTQAGGASLVSGFAAETPVQCAAILSDRTSAWYGLMFQASVQPTDDQSIAVSELIEGLDVRRIYGVTITSTGVLDSETTSDLASRQMAAGYLRSLCQYSENVYAVASLFGRAFSVNFNAQNSTITLMYKQEPSVVPQTISSTQANTLEAKRCNVFVTYDNDTAIIQYGVMSGPAYLDEIHGLDWFQNAVQNACFNLLYTTPTKIPQTDAGANQLVNTINGVCEDAVNNGLVAPGVWTSPVEFGQLTTGMYLKTGYYVYIQPMALQSQSDREARLAPPIQVAIKLAGAIQELDVTIEVNR